VSKDVDHSSTLCILLDYILCIHLIQTETGYSPIADRQLHK
jgi:hypothetical protein